MSSKDHVSSVGLFRVTSSMCVFTTHPGLRKAAAVLLHKMCRLAV